MPPDPLDSELPVNLSNRTCGDSQARGCWSCGFRPGRPALWVEHLFGCGETTERGDRPYAGGSLPSGFHSEAKDALPGERAEGEKSRAGMARAQPSLRVFTPP